MNPFSMKEIQRLTRSFKKNIEENSAAFVTFTSKQRKNHFDISINRNESIELYFDNDSLYVGKLPKQHEYRILAVPYIKQVALHLNAKIIVYIHCKKFWFYNEGIEEEIEFKKEFQCASYDENIIKDYPKELFFWIPNYIKECYSWLSGTLAYNHIFYMELNGGVIERNSLSFAAFNTFLLNKKEEDVTFMYDIKEITPVFVEIKFYYKGVKGYIGFNWRNLILHYYEGRKTAKPSFSRSFGSISNLNTVLSSFFDEIEATVSIPNLLNPPRMHFETYFTNHIVNKKRVMNHVYQLLLEKYEPEQIEEMTVKQNCHEFINDRDVALLSFLELHFVIDLKKGNCIVHEDMVSAKNAYNERIQIL